MKIKKGDTVLVITGKDKGKTGEVIAAFPKTNKVVVSGVNIQSKHEKARQDQPAQIVKVEGPIDASNVMFYDSKAKAPTRIGYTVEGGKKKRVSKKTGKVVD
ncbi:MAG: 50S ribosomal protein L24 [Firmicutes bacterium]|nr:50S ribosomal protein L24 [Bacillota bacterium]